MISSPRTRDLDRSLKKSHDNDATFISTLVHTTLQYMYTLSFYKRLRAATHGPSLSANISVVILATDNVGQQCRLTADKSMAWLVSKQPAMLTTLMHGQHIRRHEITTENIGQQCR